jgi:multidrug efflux pump subunit AcrB
VPHDHRADHDRGHLLPISSSYSFRAFSALIITMLPLASIGGVLGLFLSGEYLSMPASVGFVALWGIAVLNGVVLVSYIRKLRQEGKSQAKAVREGARLRFRAGNDDSYGRWGGAGPISIR